MKNVKPQQQQKDSAVKKSINNSFLQASNLDRCENNAFNHLSNKRRLKP